MFVAYNPISGQGGLKDWADPNQFPALFQQTITHSKSGAWKYECLIDDDQMGGALMRLLVTGPGCYIFYAKDKATLKDGMRATPPSASLKTEHGEQLGLFGGSYDFEKIGAWAANKQIANKIWNNMTDERYQTLKEEGLGKSDLVTHIHRQRLRKRGYFMIVGSTRLMGGIKKAYRMIGDSDRMIRSLPHFLE